MNLKHISIAFLLASTVTSAALAQSLTFEASTSKGTTSEASAPSAPAQTSPVRALLPEPGLFELGIFGGLYRPSTVHNIQDESYGPHRHYGTFAPELGLRAAYYPFAALGIELEAAAIPTEVDKGSGAGLWAGRGHLIGQLTGTRLTPFALLGIGALGGNSQTLGRDADFAVHAGVGVKYPFDDVVSARLDLRDTMSQEDERSSGNIAHHAEALIGLTMTLDRSKPKPAVSMVPPDRDADGIADDRDACPTEPGVSPTGCPLDGDGDHVIDRLDKCPTEAGVTPEGCPLPPDRDGDKLSDLEDDCPDVPGDFNRGCPNPDPDNDGVLADRDQCPKEPETANGYQDGDGCPDELPAQVKRFSGVIAGIEFDFGQATIRPGSRALLDAAIDTLKTYPELKLPRYRPHGRSRTARKEHRAESEARRRSEGVLRVKGCRFGASHDPWRGSGRAARDREYGGCSAEEPSYRVQTGTVNTSRHIASRRAKRGSRANTPDSRFRVLTLVLPRLWTSTSAMV
ncbi:MAG: thrombospondin type 3 repeat-containing protein [Polyangiaceae bacterium]